MTQTLVRKLLRDMRMTLIVVILLLGAFQCLWAKIVERIVGDFQPVFDLMASTSGLSLNKVREEVLFQGPGKAIRTLIGGENVNLDKAQDLLSIGYVHPLMVVIFCIWGVGRAAGALAGEVDRGTMELLLAQPVARSRLLAAHLIVDAITIPILCLSLWAGNALGVWLIGPDIKTSKVDVHKLEADGPDGTRNMTYLFELRSLQFGPLKAGPFSVSLHGPSLPDVLQNRPINHEGSERLHVEAALFGPALWVVGGLIFAICGYTMWLSSMGRFRWRVLGVAVLVTLLMFLVNLIGQMWDVLEPLRPLTIFYYYQPQQVIQGKGWMVPLGSGNVSILLVLYGVGAIGYGLALWTFTRRDLPAPL
jgi:ABC-2 type transport system permease protein